MRPLRTEIKVSPSHFQLTFKSKVATLGSCFSDSIGNSLSGNKITTLVNPFGTVYNPYSMARLVEMAVKNDMPPSDSFGKNQGVVFNYHFHSSFSSDSKMVVLEKISETISSTHHFLSEADYIFITLGTAWVYELSENNEIVSNCHKMPGSYFSKRLMEKDEITEILVRLIEMISLYNNKIRVVFTLSPVRHIKDTLEGNSISKALLRSAIYEVCKYDNKVEYFPAWEIMTDDLRDYRFYENDLIHPNALALEYIWEIFSAMYFSEETRELMKQWGAVKKRLLHRPFNIHTHQYRIFLKDTLKILLALRNNIDVSAEIRKTEEEIEKSDCI